MAELDDAAAGRRFRERPHDVGGETRQARARVGHVGGGQAHVRQRFRGGSDARIEPAGFPQRHQLTDQGAAVQPAFQRLAQNHHSPR